MATVNPTVTPVWGQTNLDGWQAIWSAMKSGDVGAAIGSTIGSGAAAIPSPAGGFVSGGADKTAQVTGTFGGGGSVAIEGSNDGGNNWFACTDPQGNVIAITLASVPPAKELTEAVIWIRPHVTAGDGSTSLNVSMFFRKTQQP